MSNLSVFIDESGDFGPYEYHAPFYPITLVLHDQNVDVSDQISYLKKHVIEQGFPEGHAIHSAPLIHRESNYKSLAMPERKRLFRALFSFTRKAGVRDKTFSYKKREYQDHDALVSRMSREIGSFIRDNLSFFQGFDTVVVYCDNGQKEITNVINAVFNVLVDADIRKVLPADYCLFQAADMICTLELLAAKLETVGLSKSELEFFGSVRDMKKNFIRPIRCKQVI